VHRFKHPVRTGKTNRAAAVIMQLIATDSLIPTDSPDTLVRVIQPQLQADERIIGVYQSRPSRANLILSVIAALSLALFGLATHSLESKLWAGSILIVCLIFARFAAMPAVVATSSRIIVMFRTFLWFGSSTTRVYARFDSSYKNDPEIATLAKSKLDGNEEIQWCGPVFPGEIGGRVWISIFAVLMLICIAHGAVGLVFLPIVAIDLLATRFNRNKRAQLAIVTDKRIMHLIGRSGKWRYQPKRRDWCFVAKRIQ
jgi:hypothetical protein